MHAAHIAEANITVRLVAVRKGKEEGSRTKKMLMVSEAIDYALDDSDDEAAPTAAPSAQPDPGDAMSRVALLQKANGSWELSANLLAILGVPQADVGTPSGDDALKLATALTIIHLESRLARTSHCHCGCTDLCDQ